MLTTPLETRVRPEWSTESRKESAEERSRSAFAPFIASLGWTDPGEECLVAVEAAEAVAGGSALISKLIEATSRNAWTKVLAVYQRLQPHVLEAATIGDPRLRPDCALTVP